MQEKIKHLLVGFSYKELFVFLFFVIVSSIFWVFTALNEVVERDVKIPVKLVNVPSEVIVTTNVSDTISVTLVDKGFTFLNYEHGNGVSPLEIDFLKYAKQSGYGSVSSSDLQRLIVDKMENSAKVKAIKPDRLEFYYNYGQSKKFPVTVQGNITPASNYYVDSIDVSPAVVTVYAQQHTLDTMHYIPTVDINEFNFVTDIKRTVMLKAQSGVKVVPDKVTVVIHPDILMDKTIELPVVAENVPANKAMRTFPSRVTVRYTVGATNESKIKESDFKVAVDYNEVSAGGAATCHVYLRNKPECVNKANLVVDQVDFLIENLSEE